MDSPRLPLDWSLVQVFLAVADTGSLSAAARRLGSSQPTVGRQVHEMEDRLGTALFRRQPRGMALTDAGQALLAPARAMQAAAGQLALAAAGEADQLAGPVRITASVFMAHHVLPPILARLRQQEPRIAIDLVASDSTDNLLFREADIAVRMYRPEQLDIVTRHLCDVPLGLFAATAYLDRVGRPRDLDALSQLDFVGLDASDLMIREMRKVGWQVDRDWFKVRCDHQTSYWQLVRAGCGVGFCQRPTALVDPVVEEIPLPLPIPALPVWLAAQDRMRRTPRVRRVWDHLARHLPPALSDPAVLP